MTTTFPQRLAMVLEKSKLNQTDFSKRIRISQPFLSQLLSGKKIPSEKTIGYICMEFSVNEEWLLSGTGQMQSNASREEEIRTMVTNALNGNANLTKAVVQALCNRTEKELAALEALLWDIVYNLQDAKKAQADSQPGRIIKIAGRDGSLEEQTLTDEDANEYLNRIDQLPDAEDDL